MSKSVVRSVKNVTKGYSSAEVKVRNATSNEDWAPTGIEMTEIAQMTHSSGDFWEIMGMLDKRLNDKGKNWRHVLKSLQVLDYCLHQGSETTVTWARQHIYIIKTLREFQYINEDGRDVGAAIRSAAKELTSLLLDEDRLRAERLNRANWKSRVAGVDEFRPLSGFGGGQDITKPKKERRPKDDDDDLEYRLALEASKNEAEEDKKRRESRSADGPDDDDLARAIKLSKEEEELRRRELEQQNAASLFDDTPTPSQQQPQPTGYNQGYQQQSAVDWFGNPVEQQQPQSTGFLNNAYSQPVGFQNDMGYNQFQQPQQTGFDQMLFQQQPQPQYMQPQQTAFNMNNPYGQQANGFGQNQPQQPSQQEDAAKPGSQNPWANLDNQATVAPQPTGSNNPFASTFGRPQPKSTSAQRAPTLNTLQEQKTATQFNQPSNTTASFPAQRPQKDMDPHASRLNALLATGDGQDTFGNVGELRIPAQHTAPGTFVNSAGTGMNRIQPAQTGNNPFMQSQFTGMPSITHSQVPAQTGPAGAFGSSNPFGAQPQQRQDQQGGSLIDF